MDGWRQGETNKKSLLAEKSLHFSQKVYSRTKSEVLRSRGEREAEGGCTSSVTEVTESHTPSAHSSCSHHHIRTVVCHRAHPVVGSLQFVQWINVLCLSRVTSSI